MIRRLSATAAAVAVGWAVGGCGSAGSHASTQVIPTPRSTVSLTRTASSDVTTTSPSHASTRPRTQGPHIPSGPSPGSLPQTGQLPSASTAEFHRQMAALWRGVRDGDGEAAMPAYFPEGAFLQVKAISDAVAYYGSFLAVVYRLDVAAAHRLLADGGRGAQLVTVQVPGAYAHWVPPGTCYNDVGYWEVPNSRVVYRQQGQERSFGVASMISWRGVWYVVHLGAVLGDDGVVDDPSTGSGYSAPSSTC